MLYHVSYLHDFAGTLCTDVLIKGAKLGYYWARYNQKPFNANLYMEASQNGGAPSHHPCSLDIPWHRPFILWILHLWNPINICLVVWSPCGKNERPWISWSRVRKDTEKNTNNIDMSGKKKDSILPLQFMKNMIFYEILWTYSWKHASSLCRN